jgi:hypothetical protein
MSILPNNYPNLYISSISEQVVSISGKDSIVYSSSPQDIDRRKIGGVWGDYEHVFVRKKFESDESLHIFLQDMINKKIPFLYNDGLYKDAVRVVGCLKSDGVVKGEIKTVNISVSFEISVIYGVID